MMRYVGSIIGAGVLGGVLRDNAGAPEIDLFRAIFVVVVSMAGLAVVATLFIHRFPPRYVESVVSDEERAAAPVPG
jgi:hypothetical protein